MMRKTKKLWLVVATLAVFLGMTLFVLSACSADWEFGRFDTVAYETNTHVVDEVFHDIVIQTDTSDVVLVPSEDDTCRVVCYEESHVKHSVSVSDGVLNVTAVDTRAWYEWIGIRFGRTKVTVFLPQSEYDSLRIEGHTGTIEVPKAFRFEEIALSSDTGEVRCFADATNTIRITATTGAVDVETLSAGSVDLSVSTGKVTVSDVTCSGTLTIGVSTGKCELINVVCDHLRSDGSTGGIVLRNVMVSAKLSVERSTGNITFADSDAAELFVKTSTGNVKGSLLTEKLFITHTGTGQIRVPNSAPSGGRCEIKTDTGNIELTID